MSQARSRYKSLLKFTIILALAVIILGSYTRLSDAGLGCPDWPGCYGQLVGVPEIHDPTEFERPLEHGKAWKEMIHRYLAGGLGLAVLVILIISIIKKRPLQQSRKLPLILLLVVIFQAALGMWTVTMLLSPVIVTAHLLGGFTTLALTWLIYLNLSPRPLSLTASSGLRLASIVGLLLVIGQIFLGGWTSTNYAALACGVDFPTCMHQWWPTMDFANAFQFKHEPGVNYEFGKLDSAARTAIQVMHRIGAIIVTTYLLIFFFALLKQSDGAYKKLAWVMLGFLALQVSLGIINVVDGLPLWVAVAHNLVAALLLLTLITINHRNWYRGIREY
ncbi:heme A synthase [Leucothrix sargassi]|nr:heme A synthase [Leucothrix sargassi]